MVGEDTYAGALRTPRAGSPAFVFVFVLIYVEFEFQKKERRDLAKKLGENLDKNLAGVVIARGGAGRERGEHGVRSANLSCVPFGVRPPRRSNELHNYRTNLLTNTYKISEQPNGFSRHRNNLWHTS